MVFPENIEIWRSLLDRLHHDFLGVEYAVDDDAETLATDLRDNDEAAFDVMLLAVGAEQAAEADQRQQLVA